MLRDWSTGKIPRYTVPGVSSSDAAQEASSADLYPGDEKILSTLHTRKELRASKGLVKLKPSEADSRELALDVSWVGSVDSDDDESQDEEDGESEGEEGGDDDEAEDEEDEDAEDEDEDMELPVSKRKRGPSRVAPRPTKKVAFSAEPTDTKQARRAAGARGSQPKKAVPEGSKTTAKSKPTKPQSVPKAVPTKKAANAPSKKSVALASTGDGEDYDFKMFF